MPYVQQVWNDGAAGGTPIDADALSHIEAGIGDVDARVAALESGGAGYAGLPAGTTLTVLKSGSSWPARPTSRADIVVQWKGADPSPAIVSSGTGGMLDGVDVRFVTP